MQKYQNAKQPYYTGGYVALYYIYVYIRGVCMDIYVCVCTYICTLLHMHYYGWLWGHVKCLIFITVFCNGAYSNTDYYPFVPNGKCGLLSYKYDIYITINIHIYLPTYTCSCIYIICA